MNQTHGLDHVSINTNYNSINQNFLLDSQFNFIVFSFRFYFYFILLSFLFYFLWQSITLFHLLIVFPFIFHFGVGICIKDEIKDVSIFIIFNLATNALCMSDDFFFCLFYVSFLKAIWEREDMIQQFKRIICRVKYYDVKLIVFFYYLWDFTSRV